MLTVKYDKQSRTISFALGDTPLGKAFDQVPNNQDDPLFPAVLFGTGGGVSVSFL